MSLREFPDVVQRSEEWHDLRRGMVTASTVKALLTPTLKVADNETSRGATLSLVAERITGVTEPSFINDDMMRGILHEPFARDKYAEHYGVEVAECGFAVRKFDGFEIGASPDGLVGTDGGIEIKCPRSKEHIRTVLADEVPAQYMAQIQTSLLVFGRQWWDYCSFHAGQPMWTKRVYPDADWHEAIGAAVKAFELAAEEIANNYLSAVVGLPATERIDNNDLGLVF